MAVIDDLVGEEKAWNLVALGSAAVAAIATRNLLEVGWKQLKEEPPPQNPAARSVDWTEALAWTIATGVLIGLARMLAQRGAAAGWRKMRGRYPKGLD